MQPLRVAGVAAFLALAALVAPPPCAAEGLTLAANSELSPITRVVEILKDLSGKIEKDGKTEEDLYETFVCWAQSIISQKKQSNTAAGTRADELEAYIKDLDAGRIELTTERADLTKQIEELSGDIEVATEQRKNEKADFEEARDEMQKAINALTTAIEVLKTATDGHESGVLLDVKSHEQAQYGSEVRARENAAMHYAVELGNRVLSKGDSLFLQRLLTGEVPTWDWKKLNRKATFKQHYKGRSFKIQGVLAKMLETFASNLEDAKAKEEQAQILYDKLMAAKSNEKQAAEDALDAMEKETGARGLSKEEANTEMEALRGQIDMDNSYIAQVEQALSDKKAEWKVRLALRADELAAVSKAISILHSDDNRDLFKKSFASQGYFFLQEGQTSSSARIAQSAAQTLQATARKAQDTRLSAMAMDLRSGSHFTEVIKAINTMLELLAGEERTDLAKKEQCEADRAFDTREAIKDARNVDDLSDVIARNKAKIQEIIKLIEDKQKQVDDIVAELKEAKAIRGKENQEYLIAKKDDQDAAGVVKQATEVLQTFYSENGLVLAQKGQHRQPFKTSGGVAPPPPPKTWDEPYGGRTEEQSGILAIMSMIHEDIKNDEKKADGEEAAALALYDKTKGDLQAEKSSLEGAISSLTTSKGTFETAVNDDTVTRRDERADLVVVMKRIKDTQPGCDWFTINYPLRRDNRHIETDGLLKAKAILQGGSFDAADPNRELKPGDAAAALIQGHLRASRRISEHLSA